MAHDIFISYRRRDASAFAARLRDRVETVFRDQVFLDVAGIDAGEDYVDKLASTVRTAKVVVAVIGPDWAGGGTGRSRLGEPGDFVTAELAAALQAGITVVPVLIEGARMPTEAELPPALQALARRHGIVITHAHFDSDAGHLVAALYRPLGIAPPGRVDRVLEALSGKTLDQGARAYSAWMSLVSSGAAALLLLQFHLESGELADYLLPLGLAAFALAAGLVGRNASRWRGAAWGGIALAASSLVAAVPVAALHAMRTLSEPWMAAGLAVRTHAQAAELPASAVAWSSRAPFNAPAPTVPCGCLQAAPSQPPAAELGIVNRCTAVVFFAAMRGRSARLPDEFVWWAKPGREFAVLALAPGQAVRLPLDGAQDHALQPWICRPETAP